MCSSTQRAQPPSTTTLSPPPSTTPLPRPSPPPSSTPPLPPLLTLPPCLLPPLLHHLPYPDALALRHTHPYFYHSPLLPTNSNIRLKVAWLVDRKARNLPVPVAQNLIFKTDQDFCGSREVRGIMEGRRRHEDCGDGGGGCEVVWGVLCGGRRRGRAGWRRRMGKGGWVGEREWVSGRRWEWEWEWMWSFVALVVVVGVWGAAGEVGAWMGRCMSGGVGG